MDDTMDAVQYIKEHHAETSWPRCETSGGHPDATAARTEDVDRGRPDFLQMVCHVGRVLDGVRFEASRAVRGAEVDVDALPVQGDGRDAGVEGHVAHRVEDSLWLSCGAADLVELDL